MKKYTIALLLTVFAVLSSLNLEARRGWRGGGWRGGRGWHRRGWYGGGYGGYWGGWPYGYGYGYGYPGFGVTIPLGGSSGKKANDPGWPYYEFKKETGVDPVSAPGRYKQWLRQKFGENATVWIKQFNAYMNYINNGSYSAPSGYMSFGV